MSLDNQGGKEGQDAGGSSAPGSASADVSLLGGGSAPPADKASAAPAAAPVAVDGKWREVFATGLDEDTAKTWNGTAQKYQTPQELAKAHVSLLKEMNNRVVIPGPDAKDEDWQKFWQRTAPKDPNEYKFDDPDYAPLSDSEKETRESFRSVAHRIGLNQKQVKHLQDWQYEQRKVAWDAEITAPRIQAEQAVKQLKSEWNVDFERNLEIAKSGAKEIGGQDWADIANMRMADGTLLGDNPKMVRIWQRAGSMISEDDRRPVYRADERQGLQEQINSITQEAIKAGKLPSSPEYHTRLQPLYDKLHGKKNIARGIR